MNCPNCGNSIKQGETFCTSCGTQLGGVQQQPIYVVQQPSNGMAIAGFVLSFLIPLLGLIFSIIGYSKAKMLNNSGKGLALAGIIISSVIMALALFFMIFSLFILKPRLNKVINESIESTQRDGYYYYR